MSTRTLFFLFFLTLFILSQKAYSICGNCNVILISLDTVGAKHIGLYNSSKKMTPNIDAFGNQSRVYLNAYSSSSWTLPAHTSMLTGLYHWQYSVFSPDNKLTENAVTIAEILKSAGYETSAFVGGFYVSKNYNLNQGFDVFEESSRSPGKDMSTNLKKVNVWLSSRKSRRPFFLFFHSYQAHEPYLPSDEAITKLPKYPLKKKFTLEDAYSLLKMTSPKKDTEYITSLYEAGLYDADKFFGTLLENLKKKNLLQNTIILLTSDHGEELGEHGEWGTHGFQIFNEVLKVPLIYYLPNSAVKTIKSPVSIVDIVPTLLADLGIVSKEKFDGIPLPTLDQSQNFSRPIFSEISFGKEEILAGRELLKNSGIMTVLKNPKVPNDSATLVFPAKSLVNRRYSIVVNNKKTIFNKQTGETISYNLDEDPDEKNPLPSKCTQLECQIQNLFIFKSGALK